MFILNNDPEEEGWGWSEKGQPVLLLISPKVSLRKCTGEEGCKVKAKMYLPSRHAENERAVKSLGLCTLTGLDNKAFDFQLLTQ